MPFDFTQILFFLLWGIVVMLFILWFIYLYVKRKFVTVLSTTVLMQIFIPLILMYPFAFSNKNSVSTGVNVYGQYILQLNTAFAITLIGILFFVFGCYISTQMKNSRHQWMNTLSEAYNSYLNEISITLFFGMLVVISYFMFKIGFFDSLFGGREYSMANTSVRPIANFFYSACSFFLLLAFTYFYRKKNVIVLLYIFGVFILALTSGTRAAVLSSVLSFIFIYYNINANNKHKANFLKLSIGGLFLLISAIYLGDLREGQYNLIVSLSEASDKILYGNNFSDLRDFSWVLSCWNGVNLYGKSILAGLLAFIPSSNFPFRADWSFGIFTAKLIGYDPTIFPGLRTGLFGEYYINFGLIGVCFAGFFYGFTIGSINHFVQDTINNSKKPNEVVYKVSLGYVISYLVYNFFNTAGFFSVYVTLLFLSIGYIRVLFRKRERSKKKVGTMRRI